MPEAPLLRVDALDAFYGDLQALFGVSLRVEAGQVVAILTELFRNVADRDRFDVIDPLEDRGRAHGLSDVHPSH
jgi:hypothetical protein